MKELADILSLTNTHSREQVEEGMNKWPTSLQECSARAALFKSLQTKQQTDIHLTKLTQTLLSELETCVKEVDPLLRDSTEVEKEGYNQVCFRGTPWSGLNSIPFALLALSIYKSYIVPGFSIFLPFLSIIMPYILLKSFYNIPLSVKEYGQILWRLWNGQLVARSPEDLLNPAPAPPKDPLTQLKGLIQNGWTLFTIGQTLWQPIQQARHFIRLDANCLSLGDSVVRVKGIAKSLQMNWSQWLPTWLPKWIELCPSGAREAFAFIIDTPFWLKHILRALGRFEVLFTFACRPDVVAAEFLDSSEPVLMLRDFGDPSIPLDRRVMSSIRLGGVSEGTAKHAILTGPNRGGKSSFLRGVLLNVVCAHAFGAAFVGRAQMTPFTWIADGMRLDDSPGEQSMFEREVAFGSAVARKEGGRGLVLYDELFHSTNPPDAARTSELFCSRLWQKQNCLSIVSTHVYSLARSAPDSVKKVCVGAWRMPSGKYLFSYKLHRGVCEVSSVDLLLKQFGLL